MTAAAAAAVGTTDPGERAVCESCRRRPATTTVSRDGAAPFSVCDDCAPQPCPVAAEPADQAGDVPPLDWSGELRLPTSRGEIARVVVGVLVPGLLALATFHVGGGTDTAFLAMVAVGVAAAAVSIWLDRRFLGRPARRPRWSQQRR